MLKYILDCNELWESVYITKLCKPSCRNTDYIKEGAIMDLRRLWRNSMPALITVILLLTAVGGYAWLATDRSDTIKLGADSTPQISLQIATYQEGNPGKYVWDGNWVNVEPNHLGKSFGKALDMQGTNIQDSFDKNAAVLKTKCQFGEIDNLTMLYPSNRVWFCLRIHEEEGLCFKNLRLEYDPVNPVVFWGSDWSGSANKTPNVPVKMENIIKPSDLKDLMVVETDGGKKPYISDLAPVSWPFPTTAPVRQDVIHETAGSVSSIGGSTTKVDADGYYYVYFRVSPNLDRYYDLITKVNAYMPCYLNFNALTVSVDVTTQP